ncbi:MAG: hypothetical protein F2681_11450 [Actinobacteria bacterium]|uniref:Unannotated protein n=1 Tax=freshwater metagenome TaxID=449393 RepID=A0A6J7PZ46_9ZZZZ|nr:hypothetical protein [Actinomycetota bacterium]MSW78686.1 hypothetical protein [Actinomycetota bacterium]MSZ83744.1 hypothetical protein [Actinomycetota bacterium]MTB19804.1 hypothetical protein [Actinomycetota bacterium]
MDIEVTEIGHVAAPQRVGRRALLGAGVGGAALSLLPLMSGRASASTTTTPPGESTSTAAAAASTTAPPKRPTDADVALLDFAQQLELTARALYDKALAAKWPADQLVVVTTIREAHEAYAQSLSGLLGRKASGTASEALLRQFSTAWAGTPDKLLAAAYDFESAAVATYAEILGKLQGTDAAQLIASIQIAEARHGTALADLAGSSDVGELLVDTEAASLLGKG